MTTGLLSAELSATCNALGYNDGAKYYTDPYVRETVKDLIRYLRRDDDDHQIRRHLGNAKVLQTDLIPIIIHYSGKEELFDVVLRLVVNLTNPALLLYQEEIPTDKTARNYYLQITSHLQSYKEAFIEQKVWDVLAKKLGDLLQIPYQERDEDVSRTMERILILVRNVLNVPVDSDLEKRPDNDASVHDQVLWGLHQAGMVDLILYIASTENEQQFYFHVLEIVTLMLREQKPSVLASSAIQRSVEEKEKDEAELLAIRQAEIKQKQQKIKKYTGSRHSRFGGTFVLKNVKSISDNDVIYHKTLDKVSSLTFDSEKKRLKTPKNLQAMQFQSGERRSAFSIRLFLKEFCVEFMNGAYNPLMRRVKENLVRAVGQPNDESYYFWALKFFMEFNRKYKFDVKFISETMSKQTFHFVQTQLETWHEMMTTDKKKIPLWSRRMHLGVKAYQELLYTLMAMDKSPDPAVRESSRVIKSNVFYVPEYRELIVFLLNIFTETKFSKEYLKDLVQTAHVFLKMLEYYSSRHNNLMVQTKSRARSKKKKSAKKSAVAVNLEAIWDDVGPQLSVVLQSGQGIPSDVVPFDAASDMDMEQQKVEAMKKIQMLLKQGDFEEAVGLLRAAREVWPENDCFGSTNMQAEEEFLAMREIFLADIGQPAENTGSRQDQSEDDEENEEDEQAARMEAHEQNFNFFDFAKRFASPRIVNALCLLLKDFEKNSVEDNHCVAKLLHRIVWDCKCPAMLFQASVFRSFQRILASTDPKYKELSRLAKFVLLKFYDISLINKKVYMELLFWKTSKDAYEIEYGYGTEEKSHSVKNMWTEEQEDELRRLFMEYERDEPEPDCIGWIMKNMIKQDRSQRSVIKKLKEMYLWMGNKKTSTSSRPPKEFTEIEEEELRRLYNEYKDALDPMACIIGMLTVHRSKNKVMDKMVSMGLVADRKELFKKRSRKSKNEKLGSGSDTDTDSDGIPSSAPKKKMSSVKNKTLSKKRNVSSGQIIANLQKVVNADLKEALVWIQSCLKDVLEDLNVDEDNQEGTALLPLSESSICAMDNPIFQQFLDIIGIHRPTDQEVYWRIPGQWRMSDITKRVSTIQDALEGKLPSSVGSENIESDLNVPKKNKRPKKKKSTIDKEKYLREANSPQRESDGENFDDSLSNISRKKKKLVDLDSSSDDEANLSSSTKSNVVKSRSSLDHSDNSDSSSNHSDNSYSSPTNRTFNESNDKNIKKHTFNGISSDDETSSLTMQSKNNDCEKDSHSCVEEEDSIIKNSFSSKNINESKNYEDPHLIVHNGKKQKHIKKRVIVESSSEDEVFDFQNNSNFQNKDVQNNGLKFNSLTFDNELDASTQKYTNVNNESDSETNDSQLFRKNENSKIEPLYDSSEGTELIDQIENKRKRIIVDSDSDKSDYNGLNNVGRKKKTKVISDESE